MKSRGLLFAAAVLASGMVHASNAGQELAQRSVCLACHQVDAKRVGPSFRAIALRYAGNEAAAEYLARSIRDGSRGLWGAIPMPAQRHVDPATAQLLAEWIMSLAPTQGKTADDADPITSVEGSSASGAGRSSESHDLAPPETNTGDPA